MRALLPIAVLTFALSACTTGGAPTLEQAQLAVEQQTSGFSPFTSSAGETYDVAISNEPLGDARILLVKPNLSSPQLPDLDAATTLVQLIGTEYAQANVCQAPQTAALEPARASGAYDVALNGWGWKVRCG